MAATENQRLVYRDKFRSLFNDAFQCWFEELARAFHGAGDFQPIRRTSGDGGLDGLAINFQLVYQVFAPARIHELRDSNTAAKIKADFDKARSTLGGRLKAWTFVHNHPEAKLGPLSAAAVNQLKTHNPNIQIEILDIDSLWSKIKDLTSETIEVLFPTGLEVIHPFGRPLSETLKLAIKNAQRIALSWQDGFLGVPHLLFGIAAVEGSILQQFLAENMINLSDWERTIGNTIDHPSTGEHPHEITPKPTETWNEIFLDAGRDINGELNPFIDEAAVLRTTIKKRFEYIEALLSGFNVSLHDMENLIARKRTPYLSYRG